MNIMLYMMYIMVRISTLLLKLPLIGMWLNESPTLAITVINRKCSFSFNLLKIALVQKIPTSPASFFALFDCRQ